MCLLDSSAWHRVHNDLLHLIELYVSKPWSEYINMRMVVTKLRNKACKTECFLWRRSSLGFSYLLHANFEEYMVDVWNPPVILMKKEEGQRQ